MQMQYSENYWKNTNPFILQPTPMYKLCYAILENACNNYA